MHTKTVFILLMGSNFMKTIKEVYGITERSSVWLNGDVRPSSNGELFPDDLEWRYGAAVEFKTEDGFEAVRSIYETVVDNCLRYADEESEAEFCNKLYRYYPVYLGGNKVEIKELDKNSRIVTRVVKLSKLLSRLLPEVPSHKLRDVVDIIDLSNTELSISLTRNPAVIKSAYKRVLSCMSKEGVSNLPLTFLQDEKTQLAVILAGTKIVGRCWVRESSRTEIYALSVFKEAIENLLNDHYQEDDLFLNGVSFYAPDGIFPFLDSCWGAMKFEGGYITPDPKGTWFTSETGKIYQNSSLS